MRKRHRSTAAFKSKVALEALREDRPLSDLAARHRIHSNLVGNWKRQAIAGLGETFSEKSARRSRDREEEIRGLHANIGELTIERDFLSRGLGH